MVRQYVQVTDQQRMDLIRLIHQESYSIAKASKVTGIPYDNAKAINRTYLREKRVHKINYRLRYQKKSHFKDNREQNDERVSNQGPINHKSDSVVSNTSLGTSTVDKVSTTSIQSLLSDSANAQAQRKQNQFNHYSSLSMGSYNLPAANQGK